MKEHKHNTIYSIINLKNNKIYIGVHSTDNLNDDYMGSGKHLKRAQKKYGIENFKKEIIFDFIDKQTAYDVEQWIVNENFITDKETYNMVIGGRGGYILEFHPEKDKIYKKISDSQKGKIPWNKDLTIDDKRVKKYTDKRIGQKRNKITKEKMSKSAKKRCDNPTYKNNFVKLMTSKEINEKRKKHIIENGSMKGSNNGMYGKKHTKEAVYNMRNKLIKYTYTIIKDNIIIDDNIIFIKDWAKKNKVSISTIEASGKYNRTINSGKLKGYKFIRKNRNDK